MKDYEIEIDYVHFNKDNICIGWSANIGFGVLTINQNNNTFAIETECLGQNFYEQVMQKFQEYILNHSIIIE